MSKILALVTIAGLTFASLGYAQAPTTQARPGMPMAKPGERQPFYLLPMMAEHQKQNMRGHLEAVNEIIAALARRDYPAIGAAAKKLETSPEMEQMCTHMGAATPGFSERALAFHSTADAIVSAAQRKDSMQVLTALNRTLNTCVSCHATYRQEVVDEARWNELTASH